MPRKKDPSLDVKCDQCDVMFHSTRQRLRYRLRFCSRACRQIYQRVHPDEFPKPPKKKADLDNVVTLPCRQCGKMLTRLRYQLRDTMGPFCSRSCYGKWRSENLTGKDSPNWKGGHTMDYGGSHWKRQRRLARERDGHTCQDCGVTEQDHGYQMDVHHITPYDLFDDPVKANTVSNLVTLCRPCHMDRHKMEKA